MIKWEDIYEVENNNQRLIEDLEAIEKTKAGQELFAALAAKRDYTQNNTDEIISDKILVRADVKTYDPATNQVSTAPSAANYKVEEQQNEAGETVLVHRNTVIINLEDIDKSEYMTPEGDFQPGNSLTVLVHESAHMLEDTDINDRHAIEEKHRQAASARNDYQALAASSSAEKFSEYPAEIQQTILAKEEMLQELNELYPNTTTPEGRQAYTQLLEEFQPLQQETLDYVAHNDSQYAMLAQRAGTIEQEADRMKYLSENNAMGWQNLVAAELSLPQRGYYDAVREKGGADVSPEELAEFHQKNEERANEIQRENNHDGHSHVEDYGHIYDPNVRAAIDEVLDPTTANVGNELLSSQQQSGTSEQQNYDALFETQPPNSHERNNGSQITEPESLAPNNASNFTDILPEELKNSLQDIDDILRNGLDGDNLNAFAKSGSKEVGSSPG